MYKSKQLFEESLYGNIIYNMLGIEAYITYSNLTDKTVQKALEVLEKGESFPQAPEKTSEKQTKRLNSTNIQRIREYVKTQVP